MTHARTTAERPGDRGESGFALVLALLALMLLTFLGLTLATSTSTELRIATNYRWQQQALYNAEAGIEAGKTLLRGMNWQNIVPAARATGWVVTGTTPATNSRGGGQTWSRTRNDQWGNTSRNNENWPCDVKGNAMGYGVVLDDGGATAPYQYKTTIFGRTLNGAFTLWVRRPLLANTATAETQDYSADNDHLILVAEGVAPFTGAQMSTTTAAQNAAVQVIEVLISRSTGTASSTCGARSGQAGQGPEGAGFGSCDPITGAGLTASLGSSVTGTGADRNVQ